MSKAILVIDMPNDLENYYCNIQIVNKHLPPFHPDNAANYIGYIEPKPIPQKKKIRHTDSILAYGCKVGWNTCINEILGETDDRDI